MRHAARSIVLVIAVALVASPSAWAACTRTWNGGTGDWSIGANWTPAGAPGASDTACIAAGVATVDGPGSATVGRLELAGGAVDGTGTIETSTFAWSGGSIDGDLTVQVWDAADITAGVARDLAGTLRLDGATTAAGTIHGVGGAIEVAGRLATAGAAGLSLTGAGTLHVTASGSVVHQSPATSSIGWPLRVEGVLDLRRGRLEVSAPATFSPGAVVQAVLSSTTPVTGFGQLAVLAGASVNGRLRGIVRAPFAPTVGSRFPVVAFASRPRGSFIGAVGIAGPHLDFALAATPSAAALAVVPMAPQTGQSGGAGGGGEGGDGAVGRRLPERGAARACDPARTRCYLLLGSLTVRRLRATAAWLVRGDDDALATALCEARGRLFAPVGGCATLRRLLAATGREALAWQLDLAGASRACFGAYVEPRGRAVVDDLAFVVGQERAFSWGAAGRAVPTGLRCVAGGNVWKVADPTFADGRTSGAGVASPAARRTVAARPALAPTVTLLDRKASNGYRLRLVARRSTGGAAVLEASLRRGGRAAQEHVYEFPLGPDQLRVGSGLGAGSLRVPLGRYGKVDLELTGIGRATSVPPAKGCTGPATVSRPARAVGTVVFTPPSQPGATRISARITTRHGAATLTEQATPGAVTCAPELPATSATGQTVLPPRCAAQPGPGDTQVTLQSAGTSPASVAQLRIRRHGPARIVVTTAETTGTRPATVATHSLTTTPRTTTLTARRLTVTGPVEAALTIDDSVAGATLGSYPCQTTWDESTAATSGRIAVTYDLLGTVAFDPTREGDGALLQRIRRH